MMRMNIFRNFALILLPLLISIVSTAQEDEPAVLMKIADEFKNNYDFDYTLEWYEKVIKDFPDTLEAGNASLNKLVILYSQISWYTQLSSEFLQLADVQYNQASAYGCRGSAWKKYKEFLEKKKKYEILRLQKGKALRKEFYRFQKDYAAKLNRLSIPQINKYSGRVPSLASTKKEDIGKILVLGQEPHLDYESRKKHAFSLNFEIFSLQHMTLGSKSPAKEEVAAYHNKEYAERKIDTIGFYYCLGLGLENSYQFRSAHEVYKKVVNLADECHNKLAHDAEEE